VKCYITFDPTAVVQGGFDLETRIEEDFSRLAQQETKGPADRLPLGAGEYIGWDTEYDPAGKLLTVGIADQSRSSAIETSSKGWKKKVGPILRKARTLCGHSIGGDIDYLVREKLAKETWVAGVDVRDSLLLCRMVDENRGKGGYSLEPLLLSDFNFNPWKSETELLLKKTGNASDWSIEQRTTRCRIDAWATAQLVRKHNGEIDDKLQTFTNRIAMSLHRVGLAGAAMNYKVFHKTGKAWKAEAEQLRATLVRFAHRHGMGEFSPTNDTHLRELLFTKMKLPVLERTAKDKEAKVDKGTIKKLIEEHGGGAILQKLLDFNGLDKLASTWYGTEKVAKNRKPSVLELIKSIPGRADIGFLHFWIFPLRARTGRTTSGGSEEGAPSSRNAQNWSPKARGSVVSRWKGGKIAVADLSKVEVVLMGWRANDGKLLDYFLNGSGYIGVAKEFWGQDVKDGTKLYKATKSLVLGLDYNMGWYKLALDLWNKAGFHFSEDWDEHCEETKAARKRYLGMFPGLRNYIRNRIGEVTETQQVVSPTGRIRHLPHHGVDSEGFWHIKNAAVNFPIQSFAFDVIGSGLIDYETALLKEHKLSYREWHEALLVHPWDLPASPVFNSVHDESDLDLHPRSGKRDLEILVDAMRNVRSLKKLVPKFDLTLKCDVQIVDNWGQAK
jgi:DNA polymerase I-like protein with 3'-5' exonuclease and polymerase domains